MQTMFALMASRTGFVTADQPHEFLRVHLVAVTVAGILLRHRALAAAVGDNVFLVRKFEGWG